MLVLAATDERKPTEVNHNARGRLLVDRDEVLFYLARACQIELAL